MLNLRKDHLDINKITSKATFTFNVIRVVDSEDISDVSSDQSIAQESYKGSEKG